MTQDWARPADELSQGGIEPGPGKRRRVGVVAGLGAAALLVGGVAVASGIASAASPSPSPSASSAVPGAPGDRDGGGFGRGHGPGPGMLGDRGIGAGRGAVRGEFVVPKSGGGYQTLVMQRGEVTAVSSTSLSVKSEDGHTGTYVVTADTLVNAARDGIDTIKVGETVHVMATKDGDTLTAVRIGDTSKMQQFRDRFRPQASPSASASATA